MSVALCCSVLSVHALSVSSLWATMLSVIYLFWWDEIVKNCQKLAPTLPCKYLVQIMHTSWVLPPKYFTANRHDSGLPKQQAPCYHFIITPPTSVLADTSTFTQYRFYRDVPLSAPLCSHMHIDSIQQHLHTVHSHWGSSTHPQNVTFNGHSLSRKLRHSYNTLLHREPCCVLSGGTQMAATWCVLMGSCNGFGQDMDTHTQMATHWEWLGDGRADYWFAQINDSQPGHLTLRELHPLSWHIGLAHWAHITASMQNKIKIN